MYLAIDHSVADHHKHQAFDTEAEAQTHINNNLPNGFVIADPGGNQEFWVVDMTAKTVTQDTDTEASVTAAREMASIRQKRDNLLAATDWAALPDSPTMSSAMTTYRTALRDYPETYASDNSAAMPTLGE